MADSHNSNLAPNSSPSDLFGDTKLSRSLVKIPSEQRKLLDRSDCWADTLSQRPNGFINVPPEVTERVKQSYVNRERGHKSVTEPHAADHILEDAGNSKSSDHQPSPSHQSSSQAKESESEEFPWSQSPERHMRPPSPPCVSQPFETQLPERSPVQATAQTSPVRPPVPAFSQSSQGPEDELEVEVPAALPGNVISVNKSALPMMTPPSAQIVPCTLEQSSRTASINPELKPQPQPRQIRYNPPDWGHKQPGASTRSSVNPGGSNTGKPSHQVEEIGSSLSSANTASSVVPSTSMDHVGGSNQPVSTWDSSAAQPSATTASTDSKDPASPSVPQSSSVVYNPPSPSRRVSLPQPVAAAAHSAAQANVKSNSWAAPFDHFTTTYPAYKGTIQEFIMACFYISLQYRRIRTSLFDDFIRAWVEGYVPYVKDCDEGRPRIEALRALDWYNEIDDNPLYTSRVVTRHNLESILRHYPDELRRAQNGLGISTSITPSNTKSVDNRIARRQQEMRQQEMLGRNNILRPAAREPEEEMLVRETIKPVAPAVKLPNPLDDTTDQILARKSFNDLGTRREEPRGHGLARSLSESASHKRKAEDETPVDSAKRRVSGFMQPITDRSMMSDSCSTTSNQSARSRDTRRSSVVGDARRDRKKKRNAEDPEERRRRKLAKHFAKQKAKRDHIMSSSAPVRNTPTSGQR
ncbi:hypothetical protein F5Y18DRAFT_378698 [Xylariaceae sp. FL1019]|nr:hypothetical protein F5Y18DRAFT_378698 [Xylariaceae sp. FL1019]